MNGNSEFDNILLVFRCEHRLKKSSIRKYTTFCGGINEGGESLKKKLIYLLTKL